VSVALRVEPHAGQRACTSRIDLTALNGHAGKLELGDHARGELDSRVMQLRVGHRRAGSPAQHLDHDGLLAVTRREGRRRGRVRPGLPRVLRRHGATPNGVSVTHNWGRPAEARPVARERSPAHDPTSPSDSREKAVRLPTAKRAETPLLRMRRAGVPGAGLAVVSASPGAAISPARAGLSGPSITALAHARPGDRLRSIA
jgi:hypothetical protein